MLGGRVNVWVNGERWWVNGVVNATPRQGGAVKHA